MNITFVPFPVEKAIKYSRRLNGVAQKLHRFFPNLEDNLIQARIEISPINYLSISLFSVLFWGVILTGTMIFAVIAAGKIVSAHWDLIFMVSGSITFLSAYFLASYPTVTARHRIRLLERDILFALRHILIEIRAGVTLFTAMASVSKGGYYMISDVFAKIVREINLGTTQVKALEKAAFENPSPHLRKAIWQISNAMKAGSDIGSSIDSLVKNLNQEQLAAIKQYGQEMNPYTMMYMMVAIIAPSLGITFLMVLSGFMSIPVGPTIFYFILIFITLFQIFFLSFMKMKKPVWI